MRHQARHTDGSRCPVDVATAEVLHPQRRPGIQEAAGQVQRSSITARSRASRVSFWVNEPGRVFVARSGRRELTTTILGVGQRADLVERMRRTSGRRIDMTPFVDAMMTDGSRLHVVIPVSTRTADTSARTHGRRRRGSEPATGGYLPHRCRCTM
jgi:hypothetical protein